MTEIQQAIEKLPDLEKKALAAWLASRQVDGQPGQEEAALLAALDRAARELAAGRGVPIEEVQRMAPRWATK